MNWFYTTRDQTQAGPVDGATLDGLFRSGAITAETLVWKEGMAGWQPYSVVFKVSAQPAYAPVSSGLRCAECGQTFPPEQLITLAGRSVCGACKPLALQKFQEGVSSFGASMSAEELWTRVQERGFNFTIGSVFSRAWTVLMRNYWPCLGVTLLSYLIIFGASLVVAIPFVIIPIPFAGTLLVGTLLQAQMMAGLNWYFVRQFRGESATLNDAFAGFRRGYGQQAIYMLIFYGVIIVACFVPLLVVAMTYHGFHAGRAEQGINMVMGIWMLIAIPFMIYLTLRWIFTGLLILDKGLKATAAMKLSRRVVHKRFWKLALFFFLVWLLCVVSVVALCVGPIFVAPYAVALVARVYEDAFGEEGPLATV